ncbi:MULTISPECIES: CDP-alcohol phosphatidyltransferase family protein [Chelativorans]|uniref:CDP-diacylglycerol--glycerol-3-phosphate 3-phosphatidyltransferase n=1 Tax=Chelativorans sp. (strain BNC1) TaxID=266779 RepID=Q11GW7_CHESB|nr:MULTISPECIES: CDP-alcohol phosphatidyltransferase family protein [Chelativorans]
MTIPNFITLLRFLLVPAVIFALLTGEVEWAFAGFVFAAVSDGVDGFIARQFNQKSELGAYLDPMADKLLLVSVFVVLGYMGNLPLWLVVAAVSRDGLIVGGVLLSAVMDQPVAMKPLLISKANTLVQLLLAAVVLAGLTFDFSLGLLYPGLVYFSGLLTVASGAAYLVNWIKHMGGHVDTGTSGQ